MQGTSASETNDAQATGAGGVFERLPRERRVALLPLWFGLLAGPVAWSVHLLVGLILVSAGCGAGYGGFSLFRLPGWESVLLLFTAALALITAAGGIVAFASWRKTGEGADTNAGGPRGRNGFLAAAGVYTSLIFLAGILLVAIAIATLNNCA